MVGRTTDSDILCERTSGPGSGPGSAGATLPLVWLPFDPALPYSITPAVADAGGPSSAMWPRAHRLVRDQLHRYAAGEPPANVVTAEY